MANDKNYRESISRSALFRHRILNTVADLLLHMRAVKDRQALANKEDRLVDPNVRETIIDLLREFEKQSNQYVQEVFRQRYKLLRHYKDVDTALEVIPVLKSAVQVYIDNIMSPDDITKGTFKVAHIEGLIHSSYEQFIKRVIDYLSFERLAEQALYFRLAYGCAGLLIKTPMLLLRRFLKRNQMLQDGFLATETYTVPKHKEGQVFIESVQLLDEKTVENLVESINRTILTRKVISEHGSDLVKELAKEPSTNVVNNIVDFVLETSHTRLFDDYTTSVLMRYKEYTEKKKQSTSDASFKLEHKIQCILQEAGIRIVETLSNHSGNAKEVLRDVRVRFGVYDPFQGTQKNNKTIHKVFNEQLKFVQEFGKLSKQTIDRSDIYRHDLIELALEQNTDNKQSTNLLQQIKSILSKATDTELTDALSSITDLEIEVVHPSRFAPVSVSDIVIGYFVITKKGQKLSEPVSFDVAVTFSPDRQNLIRDFEKQLAQTIEKLLYDYLKDKDLTKAATFSEPTVRFLTRFLSFAQSGDYEIVFVPVKYFSTLPLNANPEYSKGILDSILFFAKLYYIGVVSTQIYRLTRAPERFVYYVDIGAADRNVRVYQYLKRAIQSIKTRPTVLNPDLELDRLPAYIGIFEDLFIPIYNGNRAMEIDTLQGGDLNSRIDDLEHLLKQMLSGLGVPPSLLGYTDDYEYRTTLANQNVRFAKTIIRFQREVSQTFTDLLHKAIFLVREKLYADVAALYKLYLPPPRGLMLTELSELARSANEIADVFSDIYEKKLVLMWLLGDLVDIDKYSIKQLENELQNAIERLMRKKQKGEEAEGEESLTL